MQHEVQTSNIDLNEECDFFFKKNVDLFLTYEIQIKTGICIFLFEIKHMYSSKVTTH